MLYAVLHVMSLFYIYILFLRIFIFQAVHMDIYRVFQKNGPLVYFDDNFSKYGPILTIFSLLQQEIYGAQKLSHFIHLTFIMLPLYLVKQTLMRYQCEFSASCSKTN